MLPDDLPVSGRRPLAPPALVVALLLAGLTGFVDAVAYGRFLGIFPANQSGNAVFLGTAVSTTYVTGAIDHVGAAVSRVLTREGRIRDERALVVLLLVLVAYVGGAAVGAAAPGEWRWAMALAAGVVALIAAVWLVAPGRVVGDPEAPR